MKPFVVEKINNFYMKEMILRAINDLTGRTDGIMNLRLILQPCIAIFFAIRSGLKDAKIGNPPFILNYAKNTETRKALLKQAWADIGKIFIMAFVLDTVYQFIALKMFYPVEALIAALVLAVLPYVICRALTTRIANRFSKK